MVKCLICEREFKDKSGLSGHMRFSHPSALPVDGDKLESRLRAIEKTLKVNQSITMNDIVPVLVDFTADIVELKKVVQALLAVHYLADAKIDIETLPVDVKTALRQALGKYSESTPEYSIKK
ncbi:hypothetical protein ES708_23021 [subsurface metagenome]